MEGIDWRAQRKLKARIDELQAQLNAAYEDRRELMRAMAAAGMKQREIGAYWGVSGVAVHFAITGKKKS